MCCVLCVKVIMCKPREVAQILGDFCPLTSHYIIILYLSPYTSLHSKDPYFFLKRKTPLFLTLPQKPQIYLPFFSFFPPYLPISITLPFNKPLPSISIAISPSTSCLSQLYISLNFSQLLKIIAKYIYIYMCVCMYVWSFSTFLGIGGSFSTIVTLNWL